MVMGMTMSTRVCWPMTSGAPQVPTTVTSVKFLGSVHGTSLACSIYIDFVPFPLGSDLAIIGLNLQQLVNGLSIAQFSVTFFSFLTLCFEIHGA